MPFRGLPYLEAMVALHVIGDVKLGSLLAELTSGMPAEAVHAHILEQAASGQDSRLGGAVLDPAEFAHTWDALQNGLGVPVTAWQTVVLPTIVAFGDTAAGKASLELATSYWLAAQAHAQHTPSALELAASQRPPVMFQEPAPSATPALPARPKPKSRIGRASRRRLLAAIVIAILVAVLVMWWQDAIPTSIFDPQGARPDGQVAASASPATSPSVTPAPAPTRTAAPPASSMETPIPTPTWTGPGPAVAPSAPQALTVVETTTDSAELSWQPPVTAGTGTITHYVIQRNGTDVGWTPETSATVPDLEPARTYNFKVIAYNEAGLASPPSNPAVATTEALPAPVTATLATMPLSPLGLGQSFSVSGTGWPCGPAEMRIYIRNTLVAVTTTGAEGGFSADIEVDTSGPDPRVSVYNTAAHVTLTEGTWLITARMMAVPGCSPTIDLTTEVEFM